LGDGKLKEIISKGELAVFINTPNCTQPTRLFCCNKVTLEANHLFFYSGEALIMKVWLAGIDKSGVNFVRIDDALKSVGIMVNDFMNAGDEK
jgi:hypothetical protein